MNEQGILLFFLIVGCGMTLFLYVWNAKKTVEYRSDERWQAIQHKASRAANYSNHLLILLLFAGSLFSLFGTKEMTLTLDELLLYGLLFLSLRNGIELIALGYLNKRL